MSRLSLAARGDAQPDVVWQRYAEPARWAGWSPQIRSVRFPAERLVAGLDGVVIGWFGLRVPFIVTAVDEAARRWSWRVRLGPIGIDLDHEVEPGRARGSVTRLHVEGPLPVIVGYAPLAQLALRRLVRP